jgi:SAM-dependent methyltransferase
VVAVEPLPGMRRVLEDRVPDAESLEGSAHAIPLPDDAVDAVVVGEALHWFHDLEALREIRRVLRPHGGFAPLWTVHDRPPDAPEWLRGVGAVMEPLLAARHPDASYRGPWRSRVDGSGLFRPLRQVEERQVQRLSPSEVVDLQRSTSKVARLRPEEQDRVLDPLRDLLATHPETRGRTVLELPYRTIGYWTRAR